MKLLERFRRKKAGVEDDCFQLPSDTSVQVYNEPPPIPAVTRLKGGSLIASMGVTSDRPVADLEDLLEELDAEIRLGQPTFLTSNASTLQDAVAGSGGTSDACAVIWVLNPFVFPMWGAGPSLLQRLLYRWVSYDESGIRSALYVQEPESGAGSSLISLVGELGWSTRAPDHDNAVAIEINTDNQPIVTVLPGNSYQQSGGRAKWFRDLCYRRQKAEDNGDEKESSEIDQELTSHLDAALSAMRADGPPIPEFARRLRELIVNLDSSHETANSLLLQHLAEQEAGLLCAANTSDGTAPWTVWPDGSRGLEVFPDLSIAREALVGNNPDQPLPLGALPSKDMLMWMAKENACIGLRYGDPDEQSRCLLFSPDEIAEVLKDR